LRAGLWAGANFPGGIGRPGRVYFYQFLKISYADMLISVITPAYNEEKTMWDCLHSLTNQTLSQDHYEVIVVDDGSTDGTLEIIKKFPEVVSVSQKNKGPAAARNNGVRRARGEIILFTDADCQPFENWLEEMVKPFEQNSEVVAAKGAYKTKQRELTARFVQIEYEDKYDRMKRLSNIDFIDTYSAGFRREIFLQAGGFSEDFPVAGAEDAELSFRLADKGCKMVFNPEAKVYHVHPKSVGEYFKKKYKFACWRILAVKKHPNKIWKDTHTPQTMKFQLLLFSLLIASLGFTAFSEIAWKIGFFSVILYYLTAIPFIVKALKRDFAVGILSPAFLLVRSAAQFFGIIKGLLDNFINPG
jgi:cellulose synthase/poly-beta-1,6-N-acetylglucosamine synthase-like glycosyltransferase